MRRGRIVPGQSLTIIDFAELKVAKIDFIELKIGSNHYWTKLLLMIEFIAREPAACGIKEVIFV